MLIPIVTQLRRHFRSGSSLWGEVYELYECQAYKRNPDILKEFDFMETFNACEPQEVNDKAKEIAEKYDLPGTGGSDAIRQTV